MKFREYYELFEEIKTPEARKKYRELSMKFHPDKGGDVNTMERINNAKDDGDKAVVKLYNELMKVKAGPTNPKRKVIDLSGIKTNSEPDIPKMDPNDPRLKRKRR